MVSRAAGKLFQMTGPVTAKLLMPSVVEAVVYSEQCRFIFMTLGEQIDYGLERS